MYFEVRGYEYDIPVYIYHREYVPAGYQVPELLCYVVKCQMGNCPGCVHTHGKICSRALRRLHRTNGLWLVSTLRGTIVIRTCDQHKNLYITLFLLTIFGPDYYVSGKLMWPTCGSSVMRKDIAKNAQNTALDTNSTPNLDPAPNHINFVSKKSFFFVEKTGHHTKKSYSRTFPDFPYFILDNNSVMR